MTFDPMSYPDIQTWFTDPENDIPDNLLYKKDAEKQIMFMRDVLMRVILPKTELTFNRSRVRIINTHYSKSIKLPVYYIYLSDILGIDFVLRHNFYDWKLSVISNYPITCNFEGLISDNYKPIQSIYCEGFPKEFVFGTYAMDNYKFTVEVPDTYKLHSLFWVISKYIRGNPTLY